MAPTTELSRRGFGWTVLPGVHLVFLGNLVTADALDVDVMRNRLGSCDGGVARFAFLGRVRWNRIVGIVTANTRFQWVVRGGDDLRESRGPRGQILVAQGTIAPLPRSIELDDVGILRVGCGRAMARLAGHVSVVTLVLDVDDVIVAVVADLMTGVGDLLGRRVFQRRGAIMAVFPEVARYEQDPGRHEQDEEEHDQYCETLDLLGESGPRRSQGFEKAF
jgi:hypothetical protein